MAALRALDVGWPGYGQRVPLMRECSARGASSQTVERSDSPHELGATTKETLRWLSPSAADVYYRTEDTACRGMLVHRGDTWQFEQLIYCE